MPIAAHVNLEPEPVDPSASPSGVADEPLIGPKQLATWLSVSPHTVRQWVARGPEAGLLPRMLRINGQVRFRPRDVRTWLTEQEM